MDGCELAVDGSRNCIDGGECMKTCEVDGCGETKGRIYGKNGIHKMNLCVKHRHQLDRHGKTLEYHRLMPNKIIDCGEYSEIVLYNNDNIECARTKVSNDKVELVKDYKWHLNGNYVVSIINGKTVGLHSFISGATAGEVTDHRYGNTLDNRNYNLRICTNQQNIFNSKLCRNNTSGVTGVTFKKDRNKWKAYIMINRKQIHLGYFKTMDEAVNARKVAETKYFGEFAYKECM